MNATMRGKINGRHNKSLDVRQHSDFLKKVFGELKLACCRFLSGLIQLFDVFCSEKKELMILTAFQKFGILLFIVLLFAFSVATAQEKEASIMTFDEYAKVRHGYPYIVELQIGKGALLYFGAQHTFDPKDAHIAEIEKRWKEFRPTVAYNEGGDPSVSKTVEETVSRSGEAGLVRFFAVRNKISAFSLEPSRADEAAMLLKTYTPEQVKVFYALRPVSQFRKRKNDETIEAFMTNVLGFLSRIPALEGAPNSIAELEKSCLWLSPQLKDWRTVEQSWFDPVASHAYTNQISRLSGEFRDLHMVKLLIDEVKQGKRVFAVVGGSHVVKQERTLKALSSSAPQK
jgi:hypothetical protein